VELRQLEAFVAVAEERNFTRAAARLYVAQSGLSATIRTLERELRATLFLRTTRQVELTAAGAALLTEARRTLASARAAAEVVAAVEGVRQGSLTLGFVQASSMFDLPGLLVRYRRLYPDIELSLRQGNSEELGRRLSERSVDVVFRANVDESPANLVSVPLAQSRLVFACSPEHTLANQTAVKLSTLSELPLVSYPPGWGTRALSDRAFRGIGMEPRYAFEVNDIPTLLGLVEIGLGAALIPDAIAARSHRLRRVAIDGPAWDYVIAAESLAPSPQNPAARALWAMLADGDRTD
jgi:DNA-binding transcriptional LysR family regulator